jgi:hypothetical protein
MTTLRCLVILVCLSVWMTSAAADGPGYEVKLDVVSEGFDKKTCWVHSRAGVVRKGEQAPRVVMTMQKLTLTGSDIFAALNDLSSPAPQARGGDAEWSDIVERSKTLGQHAEPDGVTVGVCDFTPKWHAASGVLLGTGHTVRYQKGHVMKVRTRETAYSIYDPAAQAWAPWRTVEMPPEKRFENCGAGSVQRVDMDDGKILLPVYFKAMADKRYSVAVMKCSFDGKTLTVEEIGPGMTVDIGRGLYEPSLSRSGGKYFLTLRNDEAGYVAVSEDGLSFSVPKIWSFDDGEVLGNYNTQQHWVTHSDGLFLVYTRRGAENDHVFRHRAPLFMARIDPQTLQVVRASEQVIVPEKGARLGNFGIVNVNADETWVTVAEWMQTNGPDYGDWRVPMKYGANNRVYAARILWQTPNREP